ASPLNWIEQRLSDSGQTIENLIQIGNQQQAADLIKNIQLVLDAMMEKDKKDKEKILTLSKNQPM
ncbi:MAG: hypothetical protein ACK419_05360, partial [Pyrinomonadaceae bacterium]